MSIVHFYWFGTTSPYAIAETGKLWFTSAHPAIIKDNHVFIPLRSISLMANANISWDQASNTVSVTKAYSNPSPIYTKIKNCVNTEVFKAENLGKYMERIKGKDEPTDYSQMMREVNAMTSK